MCVNRRSAPKTVSPACPRRRVNIPGLTSETRTADTQPPTAPVSPSLSSTSYLPWGDTFRAMRVDFPRQDVVRNPTPQQAIKAMMELIRAFMAGTLESKSSSKIPLRFQLHQRSDHHMEVSDKVAAATRVRLEWCDLDDDIALCNFRDFFTSNDRRFGHCLSSRLEFVRKCNCDRPR